MKKIIIVLILIIVLHSIWNSSQAQTAQNYPEVGKPCPDFVLKNIKYFSKDSAKLSDFKGKWLILDFWNKQCTSCVNSFPEVNRLSNKYSNKIQYMMVGLQDKENKIQGMYAKYRNIEHLKMPCAFDSLICRKFDIVAGPYIVAIDENGVVRFITYELTDNTIKQLLEKKSAVNLFYAYRNHETRPRFNVRKPFLVDGNGGADSEFEYRTVISKWQEPKPMFAPGTIDRYLKDGRFQEIGAPINWLYNLAYLGKQRIEPIDTELYGKYYSWPIWEVKDTSKIDLSARYSYSLIMPPQKSTQKRFMKTMQSDLHNYFGYEVTLEKREMPFWSLIALSPDAIKKLKSKGGPSGINESGDNYGYDIQNISIGEVLGLFFSDFNHAGGHPVVKIITNDIGYSGPVDLKLDCNRTDFNDLRIYLRAHGLDLVERKKLMECIVIRDPVSDASDSAN